MLPGGLGWAIIVCADRDRMDTMRVETTIEETELQGDDGNSIPSVSVTCKRCGHSEEAYGSEDSSIKRCAVQLRENCPRGERKFYTTG